MKKYINILLAVFAFVWTSKDFNFLEDAVKFMNTLPESQRGAAYVIALNSQRSGFIAGYYTVIYQKFD